jgi:hypothetical protein
MRRADVFGKALFKFSNPRTLAYPTAPEYLENSLFFL